MIEIIIRSSLFLSIIRNISTSIARTRIFRVGKREKESSRSRNTIRQSIRKFISVDRAWRSIGTSRKYCRLGDSYQFEAEFSGITRKKGRVVDVLTAISLIPFLATSGYSIRKRSNCEKEVENVAVVRKPNFRKKHFAFNIDNVLFARPPTSPLPTHSPPITTIHITYYPFEIGHFRSVT